MPVIFISWYLHILPKILIGLISCTWLPWVKMLAFAGSHALLMYCLFYKFRCHIALMKILLIKGIFDVLYFLLLLLLIFSIETRALDSANGECKLYWFWFGFRNNPYKATMWIIFCWADARLVVLLRLRLSLLLSLLILKSDWSLNVTHGHGRCRFFIDCGGTFVAALRKPAY